MLKKIFAAVTQRGYDKEIRGLRKIVTEINKLEEDYQKLSEEELKGKTATFKAHIAEKLAPLEKALDELKSRYDEADSAGDLEKKKELQGLINVQKAKISEYQKSVLNDLLPEAFAVVKNACRRLVGRKVMVRGNEITWDMVPFDVQLIGGIALHQGKIAEMRTGEGKTLVATAPLYLNALTGKGVHLVTVNDYLAQRDAEWMGFLYTYLGLTVGIITNGMPPQDKKNAYAADITYGTNNEFGFDYLRDNMATSPDQEVGRELNFAIVDEVDSILIDEARTPLIISAPAEESNSKYQKHAGLVAMLVKDDHYVVDEKQKTATLTESGIKRMEEMLGLDNIYTEGGFSEVHHIEQALRAQACYQKDVDYIIKDGEVLIVDEFTGRVLPGRRYSDGLHQAIEAKENVEIKQESRTLATITFQNYFRLFDKLAGMTGTAATEAEEFYKIYQLEVLPIPTNRNMVRDDKPDLIFKNEAGKLQAVVGTIKEKNEKGQPVLVGTIAIEKSEMISQMLKRAGVKHNVLNAKYHEQEAEIISHAGEKGAVTIATNMAGRGTDIKLGEGVKETGGLVILGTERHEARRIDNQLRGRAGRQGDPGESQFFISLDDNLMRIFGGDRIKKMMEFLKIPDDMPIENKSISGALESAQRRVEGYHFDIRKHVVEYDDVMNRHREIIYSRRRKILHKNTVKPDVMSMIHDFVVRLTNATITNRSPNEYDMETLVRELKTLHYDEKKFNLKLVEGAENDVQVEAYLEEYLLQVYDEKEKALPDAMIMRNIERGVYLRTIDTLWMEHLDQMQALRDAVSLHGYGQKDPLVEYKKEGYIAFSKLLGNISQGTLSTLFKLEITPQREEKLAIKQDQPKAIMTNQSQIENILVKEDMQDKPHTVKLQGSVKHEAKVGRNDPCPCGSGKKYKMCHGKES